MENECLGCGCTESNACVKSNETCSWLVLDSELGMGVCSNCPDYVEHFEKYRIEMAKAFSDDEQTPSECPACHGHFVTGTLFGWICSDCGASDNSPNSKNIRK